MGEGIESFNPPHVRSATRQEESISCSWLLEQRQRLLSFLLHSRREHVLYVLYYTHIYHSDGPFSGFSSVIATLKNNSTDRWLLPVFRSHRLDCTLMAFVPFVPAKDTCTWSLHMQNKSKSSRVLREADKGQIRENISGIWWMYMYRPNKQWLSSPGCENLINVLLL